MRQNLLNVSRNLAILFIFAAAVLFVMNLPILYLELQQTCETCTMTIKIKDELSSIGWNSNGYGLYLLLLSLSFTLGSVVLGGLILKKRPNDPMALLVAVTFSMIGLTLTIADPFYIAFPTLIFLAKGVSFIATMLFGVMICYFPNFRTSPRWCHFLALALFFVEIIRNFYSAELETLFWTDILHQTEWLILLAMGVTQIYRYRRLSTTSQKQQTKLPVFAFLIAVLLIIVSVQFPINNLWGNFLGQTLYFTAISLIPISFFLAIIRYRLWAIDPLINRTILYVILTAVLLGIYSGVIFVLSSAFHVESSTFISLIGTIIVAVLVQPLHKKLHMIINRLMYGDRQDPYAALVRLGNRLEATSSPELVLDAIVTSVSDALKLPYVSLVWPSGEIASESGTPIQESKRIDILYQGERVAELCFEFRDKEEEWVKADRQIIKDLTRQAGAAIHAVRLTQELQRSRENLVTAREDERRRLRRDLHDGLGPEIAAFSFRVEAARNLLKNNPYQANEILLGLQKEIRNAVDLIRRLVHNLQPPVLDEYGLGEAVAELVRANRRVDLDIKLEIPFPLPILNAAVEVAAYRIVQEGLANVIRHAHASKVSIMLIREEQKLIVTIEDDGVGLPPIRKPGVGLNSMRERAEELRGIFIIGGCAEGGTSIRVEIPNQNGGKCDVVITGSTC